MDRAAASVAFAAPQQPAGTMPPVPALLPLRAASPMTVPTAPRQYFIKGLTLDGRSFRPSDWAERLAGAMASFRPGGSAMGIAAFIGYSPYCEPQLVDGVKCVLVNEALRELEPMAWDFVMNFARDNALQVADATEWVRLRTSGGH
jgi:hypothetical protein